MAAGIRILQTPRQLAGAAAACTVAFAGVLAIAYGSDPAARLDAIALEQFSEPLRRPLLARAAREIAHLANPLPFVLLAAALCLGALAYRGAREAVAVGALLAGANVTTQFLKPILASPRGTLGGWTLGPEAFPSGHSTAAMSLALAGVLVAPRVLRPVATVAGAAFAIAVGFSMVALDAHFPSDVAGGYLVAGGWCFAVLAALLLAERRRPRTIVREAGPSGVGVTAIVLLGALMIGAAVGASRIPDLLGYARGHTVFAVVAAAAAALAALLVAAAAAAAGSLRARRR